VNTKVKMSLMVAIIVSVLVFVVAQSGGNSSSPTAVAQAYFDAMAMGNFTKVKELRHSECWNTLRDTEEPYLPYIMLCKVTSTVEKIYGDYACVALTVAGRPGQPEIVILKKENGKWKVWRS